MVALVFGTLLLGAPACRCVEGDPRVGPASASVAAGSAASATAASGSAGGPRQRGRARARGVLQLGFSGVGEAVVGCQVHLLDVQYATKPAGARADRTPRRELQVDLGTTRRRTFFVKHAKYWRLPTRFGYIGPAEPDRIEVHTTVDGAHGISIKRPPSKRFVRRRLRARAETFPSRWGIACVLRRAAGGGAVIDAAFIKGGRPRVYGVRSATREQLAPAKVRDFLSRLVGLKR